ncbi:MAG: hypothetical protein KA354_21165 [Phycisphaerae bacterium]|nr:hypothetical protein [Phycisphaerae bacterium]
MRQSPWTDSAIVLSPTTTPPAGPNGGHQETTGPDTTDQTNSDDQPELPAALPPVDCAPVGGGVAIMTQFWGLLIGRQLVLRRKTTAPLRK